MSQNIEISQTEWELIERFILKELTPEEQNSFSEKLLSDPDLQAKVREVELVLLGIQESVLLGKLEGFHQTLTTEKATPDRKTKVRSLGYWLAAASVIGIIAVISWVFFSRPAQNDKLYSDFYKPDAGLISAMSTSANYAFDKAMIDYKTGDYEQAIQAWQELSKTDPTSDTLNYFLASAYLASGNQKQAIILFDKVINDKSSGFVVDAYWYKGLALLKLGKKEEAVLMLEQADHSNKKELLKELNN